MNRISGWINTKKERQMHRQVYERQIHKHVRCIHIRTYSLELIILVCVRTMYIPYMFVKSVIRISVYAQSIFESQKMLLYSLSMLRNIYPSLYYFEFSLIQKTVKFLTGKIINYSSLEYGACRDRRSCIHLTEKVTLDESQFNL